MPSHRVVEEWLGRPVEALEDLLRPLPIALRRGDGQPEPREVWAGG